MWDKNNSPEGISAELLYTSDEAIVKIEVYPSGSKAVLIQDPKGRNYKIVLFAIDESHIGVSVSAAWSDSAPGELANFTRNITLACDGNDDLSISELGVLSVMARQETASHLNLQMGLSLQLSKDAVPGVRLGIQSAKLLLDNGKC